MQLKSFLIGVIVGTALTVVAVMYLRQSQSQHGASNTYSEVNPANNTQSGVQPDNLEQGSDSQPVPSASDDVSQIASAAEITDNGLVDSYRDDAVPIAPTSVMTGPVSLTDAHKQLVGENGRPDKSSGRPGDVHSALENEPRDHDWSYFMEQALGQFLGSHPEIVNFDIARIECRSTICEIQAFGVDERAGPIWGIILHDLRNQPWSDFGQTGSSSGTIDGRLVIMSHLHRLSEEP